MKRTIFASSLLAFYLAACSAPTPSSTLPSSSAAQVQSRTSVAPVAEYAAPGEGSYITLTSIGELTDKASLIVIGTAVPTQDTVNMARDVNDITKPDPNLTIVGQVYKITVERTLKGTPGSTIYVVQPEAFIANNGSPDVATIQNAKTNYEHIPMRDQVRYLMFLEPLRGVQDRQYYVGIAQPWRFDLSDNAKVKPESPWPNAINVFPSRTEADLLQAILQRVPSP